MVALSMGEYAYVPGYLLADARRLIGSPLWQGVDESPMRIRVGSTPPPLELKSLTGETFELGESRGRPLLVFFFHERAPYATAALDVLLDSLMEARSRGRSVHLAAVCLEDECREAARIGLEDYPGQFDVFLPADEDQLQVYEEELSTSEYRELGTSALLLGATGQIEAVIRNDSVFQSFAAQVSACLDDGS